MTSASPIPVPHLDTDEPVAVIPTASVAPIDGPPYGDRINIFTVAPKEEAGARGNFAGTSVSDLRKRVLGKPLTSVAVAFAAGFIVARVLR